MSDEKSLLEQVEELNMQTEGMEPWPKAKRPRRAKGGLSLSARYAAKKSVDKAGEGD